METVKNYAFTRYIYYSINVPNHSVYKNLKKILLFIKLASNNNSGLLLSMMYFMLTGNDFVFRFDGNDTKYT